MKKSTIMKSMKKTIFAFCIAMSVFMYNSTYSFAAICNQAPDKVHHFESHAPENAGVVRLGSTHMYLYGYDSEHNAIYKNDCRLMYYYRYCNFACKYCDIKQDDSRHEHYTSFSHSVNHY